MISISQFARERFGAGERDPKVMAQQYFAEAVASGDISMFLMPLHGQFQSQLRMLTKKIEQQADFGSWAGSTDGDSTDDEPANAAGNAAMAARFAVLTEKFYVPSAGYVPWETATVALHRERISYNDTRIAGYRLDSQKHQDAIDAIEATGLTTLGEVRDQAAITA